MATLDEIRQKYPAYATKTDGELADAIYGKFYEGKIGRDEFNAKIGFKPEVVDNRGSWERLPKPRTMLKGMEQGVGDIVVGATQLGAHALPNAIVSPEAAAAVDRAVKARESGIQATRPDNYDINQVTNSEGLTSHVATSTGKGFDMARVVGNAVGTLPAAAMGPVAGTIAGSVVMPTTGDNFWMDKGKQALTGAAVGVGTKALGSLFAPEIRPAAQNLADRGVKLTPGMMGGKFAKEVEDKATSIPGTGNAIASGQRTAVESFNRAVYDEVLSPIGLKYAGKEIGYAGVNKVDDMLGAAYDKLLPKLQFRADGQLVSDLNSNLSPILASMAEPQRKQFIKIFETYVDARLLKGGGAVGGEVFKKVESEISAKARQYSISSIASEQDIGTALTEVKRALRDNLERANPAHAGELQPLNAAYARYVRLQGAAAKRVSSEGVFTPGDLAGAVKQADTSVRKGQFARGDALMQDLATDAQNVMGNSYPNSGTTGRLLQATPQGLVAGMATLPAAAPYSKLGLSLMNLWATPGPVRQLAGQATREVGPLLTPGAAQEYQRLGY